MMYSGSKAFEMLRGVAKKTGSPVAKELVKDKEYEDACCLAHQLFDEALEEFKEGEMSWKDVVKDLYENLMAMDMPKPPEVEEEDEEESD